jgi:Fic/DOC family
MRKSQSVLSLPFWFCPSFYAKLVATFGGQERMAENRLKRIDELKARIDQFRPLDKPLLKQIREYFRIGLTYSSNALEGNSLTETETKVIIEDGITIGGKPLKDHYEAIGHSEAYDMLYRLARNKAISEKHIKDLHRIFFFRIDPKNAGKYRKERVIITGSEFLPPSPDKVPALMKSLDQEIPPAKEIPSRPLCSPSSQGARDHTSFYRRERKDCTPPDESRLTSARLPHCHHSSGVADRIPGCSKEKPEDSKGR